DPTRHRPTLERRCARPALALVCGAVVAPACGGDDAPAGPGPDAAADGGDGVDVAPPEDAATDAGPTGPWGAPQRLENDTREVVDAHVGIDGAGNAIAVWSSRDALAGTIWASRFTR